MAVVQSMNEDKMVMIIELDASLRVELKQRILSLGYVVVVNGGSKM